MKNAILKTVVLDTEMVETIMDWADNELERLRDGWFLGDITEDDAEVGLVDAERLLTRVGEIPKHLVKSMMKLREKILEQRAFNVTGAGAPEGDGEDD